MGKPSELTSAIDTAIDFVRRHELEVTPKTVWANLKMSPDALAAAQASGIKEAIQRRLKSRGEIITDADPRDGGRPRNAYYESNTQEHKEQLRVQAENGRYTQNRIAAESKVIEFMDARTQELGYEPPWITIAEDVSRIYQMNGVAPPA